MKHQNLVRTICTVILQSEEQYDCHLEHHSCFISLKTYIIIYVGVSDHDSFYDTCDNIVDSITL